MFLWRCCMESIQLLLIEKKHSDYPQFASALRQKGMDVQVVQSGGEALKCLQGGFSPDLMIINAATLRTNGKRICQSLRANGNEKPIILILSPDRAGEKSEANVLLVLPFTVQKLINRIRHLLPPDGKDVVKAGPIRLNPCTGVVRCLGKQTRLTPRLVRLLTILIEHRGEAVERKTLFSEVWETDYTDDTRTLDVHISWLRRALEPDPNQPRFLKTVRGVGYRLDL